MPVWMKHPLHGRTPAVGPEVEWNKANGWVEDEGWPPGEPIKEAPGGTVDQPLEPQALREELTLEQRYTEKFGKPPHHRMKSETIKRALDEE